MLEKAKHATMTVEKLSVGVLQVPRYPDSIVTSTCGLSAASRHRASTTEREKEEDSREEF